MIIAFVCVFVLWLTPVHNPIVCYYNETEMRIRLLTPCKVSGEILRSTNSMTGANGMDAKIPN